VIKTAEIIAASSISDGQRGKFLQAIQEGDFFLWTTSGHTTRRGDHGALRSEVFAFREEVELARDGKSASPGNDVIQTIQTCEACDVPASAARGADAPAPE